MALTIADTTEAIVTFASDMDNSGIGFGLTFTAVQKN